MITLFSFFKYYFSNNRVLFLKIKQITGIAPINLNCYQQSLRHHSIANKIHNNGSKDSNERLEFLGDAVLNAVIAEYLFKKYPYKDEGFLTELRSKIVSRVSLNDLALKIGLSELVEYDKKSMQNINVRNSIFGNALEAFIGAIFLDNGFKKSKYFIIEKLLRLHIDVDKLQQTEKNFKGRLIEYTQKSGLNLDFKVEELSHGKQKIFKVSVIVNNKAFGNAEHTNKKQAEQQASEKAIELLKNMPKEFFANRVNEHKISENEDDAEDFVETFVVASELEETEMIDITEVEPIYTDNQDKVSELIESTENIAELNTESERLNEVINTAIETKTNN
ncbi:MAG: ribonuclease III [Candidatus Methylacidiphilales bacterium]